MRAGGIGIVAWLRGWQRAGRLAAVLGTAFLLSCARPQPPTAPLERQLTDISGVARSPAISPDGKLLAFVSSPAEQNAPQVWVVATDGGGSPTRLTEGPWQNYDPEFAPDGQSIYFTSNRPQQGIYRVPVTGGAAELLLEGGYAARVSPDGKTLAYGAGGKLYRRALQGGLPVALLPEVENSYAPVWSPDSGRLLVLATIKGSREPQWWTVPAAGGQPQATPIASELQAQGFSRAVPNAWLPGDWIVFTGLQGETQTLWKFHLGRDQRIHGAPSRATEDPEGDYDAYYRGGRLAFARTRVDLNFWVLRLDPSGTRILGSAERLSSGGNRKGAASLARDGGRLLYSAEEQRDHYALYLEDFSKKSRKRLRDGFYSLLRPDGARYVYADDRGLLCRSTGWWPFWSHRLCIACGMPREFSRDGNKLLLWTPGGSRVDVLDAQSGQIYPALATAADISGPKLSPDGEWLSFVARTGQRMWQTFAAPIRRDRAATRAEWVALTPASDSFHFAFWSPDGSMIYILTGRGPGNLRWLEAQKLDAATKHPVGNRVPVYEFAESRVPTMDPTWNNVSVIGDRILLELGDSSTNLWSRPVTP